MNLSQYVFEQSNCYFNTVTAKVLPKDSDEAILRENFFLEGQEQQSLHWKLFEQPVKHVGIKLIPTWRCNLRCTHCFVLHKLQRHDPKPLDVTGFLNFVDSILDTCDLERFGISFIGGEATLEAEKCVVIWDQIVEKLTKKGVPDFVSNITTNGTNWSRPIAELFSRIGTIMVSVDGNALYHNKQRKPYSEDLKGVDLYELALRNIKRMSLMGFSKKIVVQASLYDEGFDKSILRSFYKDILSCGVQRDQIVVGSAVPTPINKREIPLYEKYLKQFIFNKPCCTYRLGKEIVVDNSGDVFADYFKDSKGSLLGTLDNSFSEIIENHKQFLLNTMPVLNDDKCKSCPVIGACWGRCSNTEFLKPSEHCDQQSLLDLCQTFARNDTLVSKYIKSGQPNDNLRIPESDFYTHS